VIEKKILERKEIRDEDLKEFMKLRDKELMLLFIDESSPNHDLKGS
jgi:hypothetical protein